MQANLSTNLLIDELLGLVLQSVAKPPIGVDENVFRNNLNHRLNSTTPAPLLDTVCQELAQVEGELHTGTSTNPILINRLQPGGTNHSKSKNTSSGGNTSTFGHKASTNALAFQGQQPSTALMAAKGDTCKYCEIKGHWASTCRKFARDLRNGKINVAQLAEYAKDPQFKLNPSFVKVRAVDLNATPDDTVLTSKNDISFLLNNLVLGEEPTDTEALVQQQAADSLLTRPDIAVPDNIHQAFSSPESSEWRKAAELELTQLEKLEVVTSYPRRAIHQNTTLPDTTLVTSTANPLNSKFSELGGAFDSILPECVLTHIRALYSKLHTYCEPLASLHAQAETEKPNHCCGLKSAESVKRIKRKTQ
ncbi:hypothetical protein H4Q26_008186 [Puccinia striiformis f. sp. tritici PST-130]|nr:hypothetical protein H4Q26_008186 [Puccinia striiformis f. sp. tritici PST-130]